MRLFIALELPQAVINYAQTVQNKFKTRDIFIGTYPQPEQMHVTLAFIGEQPEEAIPTIIKQMHLIQTPIEVLVDGVNLDNEKHPHVIWIDLISDQLTSVANLLHSKLELKEQRPFKGHLTIARIKKCSSVPMLKKVVDSCAKNPLTFSGTTLTLYASTLTSNGPIYERMFERHLQ
jgi:2'-5' RNA ligase